MSVLDVPERVLGEAAKYALIVEESSLAQQEAVSRQINEAIERGIWPGEDASQVRMHCECSRPDCNSYVHLRVEEYEHIRSHARRFILTPGHELPQIENVLGRHADYFVVEKIGAAGETAEELDPRSDSEQEA
jgi:hypothetical protein